MRQFILNNTPYSQTDREDLVIYYLSIGCVEVGVLYDFSLVRPIWDGFDFVESATPEEVDEIIYANEIQNEVQKTAQRQLDGNSYFLEFSSILAVKQNREEITQAQRNGIDDILEGFKNSILCGYYKTALRKLNDFTTTQIDEIGLDFYNKLKTDVENYIMFNYNDPSLSRVSNLQKK